MITEIKSGKKVFALFLDVSDMKDGVLPVTHPNWPLQMLLMKRKTGHIVGKHMHKKILKSSKQPQEALIVIKGSIEADIFDRKGKIIGKQKVGAGQCLLIVEGAHEITVTKNALIYAIKDGPYIDDKIILK